MPVGFSQSTRRARAETSWNLIRNRKSLPLAVLWVIVAGAALRSVFFFLGQNNGGDALARAGLVAGWMTHPSLRLNFEPWLPFHFWLMAGLALLLGKTALAARALSLVLGIASLWVLWRLTKEIYGRTAALFSLVVFALYSLHIAYSTTSSSEVPYLFFVLVGLLCFFMNRRTGSLLAICASAIALGVASGIRYEAWVCIFSVLLAMILQPRFGSNFSRGTWLREILLFGSIAGLWPCFWLLYQWRAFSKPLYGVTMNYHWVPEQAEVMHRSALYRFALPPGVLLITLTPLILAAALYGFWKGMRRKSGREFVIIVAVFGLAFFSQIALGGLLPLARYTITLGTFAIIGAGYGLARLALFLPRANARQFAVAVALLMILNLGAICLVAETPTALGDKMASVSPLLRFPRHIGLVREYLLPRLAANDRVVIDDYNVESNIVAAAIGLPLLRGNRAFLASEDPMSDLDQYVAVQHPDYIIYSEKGTLRAVIPLPDGCSSSPIGPLDGMTLSCVFQDDVYRIYKISYSTRTLASR